MRHDDFPPRTVWLVGAGPGDPELLTRKAERLIGAADVVFHDALVGAGVLDLVAPGARRVSVGKRSGRHSVAQETIDGLIVATALEGARVVRLKGGDPAIFGRTAEEMAACRAAGVPVRICAGVTAASAAAAAGGSALTSRGVARRLVFVTAHLDTGAPAELDAEVLADVGATLAVYMGRAAAGSVARQLITAGRRADTPVLVVVNASLPQERVVHGRLDALAFLVEAVGAREPVMLLIGEAVRSDGVAHNRLSRDEVLV
jgi:uroporphyrin-III C-methyltransferase